jgi:hypothetical protein
MRPPDTDADEINSLADELAVKTYVTANGKGDRGEASPAQASAEIPRKYS